MSCAHLNLLFGKKFFFLFFCCLKENILQKLKELDKGNEELDKGNEKKL